MYELQYKYFDNYKNGISETDLCMLAVSFKFVRKTTHKDFNGRHFHVVFLNLPSSKKSADYFYIIIDKHSDLIPIGNQ